MIYFIVYFIAFAIAAGFTYFFYWVPKIAGYKKLGIILGSLIGSIFVWVAITTIFEHDFFTRSNAKSMLITEVSICKMKLN